MKKRFLSIIAVIAMFCLVLVGCGGGGSDTTAAPAEQSSSEPGKLSGGAAEVEEEDFTAVFAGEWQAIYMDADDPEDAISEDDMQMMRDMGYTADLTLSEDGTWKMVIFGEDFGEGIWEAKSATEAIIFYEDEKITVSYDASTGVLSLIESNDTIFFVRLEDAPAASTGSSSSNGSAAADLINAEGYPTLYAITELDGGALATALEVDGYTWDSDMKWWISDNGHSRVYVSGKSDYEYLDTEIAEFDVFGKGEACMFVIVVDDTDYSSCEEAFRAVNNIETIDEEWPEDDFGAFIVQAPSGEKAFVIVTHSDKGGVYFIDIFNDDAISGGLFDELVGDNYGSSIDELQSNLF